MKRWIWAALVAVLALAVAMRFLPLMNFMIWGSDSGEYYVLTKRLVDTSAISTAYNGWGFGYPYFPGMFILTGEVQLLTGLPIFQSLLGVAPIIASLSVLVIFLISHRTFDDPRAGILAGAFLAVATPVVYATSHPMPGSIGDFLALLCILLLLKSLDSKAGLIALGLATFALVMTHHLSTFFVLIPVLFALLVRELVRARTDRRRTWVEGGYIVFLLSVTMLYWYAYAVPFRERVIPEGFHVSPAIVLVLAYAALLAVPVLVWLRRRFLPGARYRPSFPTLARVSKYYAAFVVTGALIVAAVALVATPGTTIRIDERASYWFLPLIFLLGLSIAGIARAEFSKDGFFVLLWMGAISITLLFAIATTNHVLLPYRQTQYFVEPLAVLTGAGAVFIHDHWNPDDDRRRTVAAAAVLSVAVLLCAGTAYPPREIMGGFEEGTTYQEMDSVLWLREDGRPAELVATDHRMSTMTFGFAGLNASWDDAYETLHGNLSVASREMAGLETPSGFHRVSLVLLDPSIESGVALKQWETAKPLSGEAKAKFSSELFTKLYESNGVKIYRVDQTLLS